MAWRSLALAWIGCAFLASSASATVGYTGRASGFDLAFDGTVGNQAADLAICDGQGDSASTVGEDIDGNGVNDRQVYVDLTSGTNSLTCGLPASPCLTITYAMNGTNVNVTGGPIQAPAAAQSQAICFKGTGREQVVFTQSGAAGTYTLPQTGHQANSFTLPRYPFILCGWDADNDNDYPPHDTDDVAVLDGNLGGTSIAYALDNGASGGQSRIEVAHFTIQDYGLNGETTAGAMRVGYGGGTLTEIYIHDLVTNGILKGVANDSARDTFIFFTSSSILQNVALVNINSIESGGGYWTRGSGVDSIQVLGPYRFQNISVTGYGASGDFWAGMKLFDTITGIEVIDSSFNSNAAAWSPGTSPATFALGLSPCTRGWRIIGNTLTDFKSSISIQGYAEAPGFCENRTLTDVLIDRNQIRQTYAWGGADVHGLNIDVGNSTTATSEDVTITNNFFSNSMAWDDCMRLDEGNPSGTQPGTVVIVNNTCDGDVDIQGAIVVGHLSGSETAFPQQNYVIEDNIISGITTGSMYNLRTTYAPTNWIANGNIFDSTATWQWNGVDKGTIAAWRTASGGDAASTSCNPTYIDASTGNLRLNASDTCALNAGIDTTTYTTHDIDGTTRPQGAAFDSGGYELPSATTPAAPYHVRAVTTPPVKLRWDEATTETVTGFRVCLDGLTGTNCLDVGLPTGQSLSDTYAGGLSYTIPFISVNTGRHSFTVEAYNGSNLSSPSSSPLVVNVFWR